MKMLDLFSGIGGFSLAGRWMGWETVAFCEIDKFCQYYLRKNFPNIPIHDNIKTTDFTVYRGLIDIICGGDPCQPSSVAGKRQGKADARYLWPENFRAIVESEAKIVVNENVTGTISNGILDQKISDLENAGYTCWPPFVIPASAVGAWHRRDRVWLIAYSSTAGAGSENRKITNKDRGISQANCLTPKSDGINRREQQQFKGSEGERSWNELNRSIINASDTINKGLQGSKRGESFRYEGQTASISTPQCNRSEQWEENWYEAATRLCTLNDGIPGGLAKPKGWRVNALKACGNAIVPQVAYQIFKAIDQYNQSIAKNK